MTVKEGGGVVQDILVAMETGVGPLGVEVTRLTVGLITSTVLDSPAAKSVCTNSSLVSGGFGGCRVCGLLAVRNGNCGVLVSEFNCAREAEEKGGRDVSACEGWKREGVSWLRRIKLRHLPMAMEPVQVQKI